MKNSLLKTSFSGVQSPTQDLAKSLNQNYSNIHQEHRLYFLPTYPDFSYTPLMQTIGLDYDLFGVYETIFHFKQAFTQRYPHKTDFTVINITMLKNLNGEFNLLMYWNGVFLHEIALGARNYSFKYFELCLYDNIAGCKHLLLLPEEISNPSHFINS